MEPIKVTLSVDRDTKNTRRYMEDGDGPYAIGTLYVQKWALRQLNGGSLPDKVEVTVRVVQREDA